MDSCFIRLLLNRRKVNAFTFPLSVVLSKKLFYLRCSVVCLTLWRLLVPKAQSTFPRRLTCVHKCAGFIVSRFLLIARARTLFQLVSCSHLHGQLKERVFLSDIADDQRRENTVNLQSEPLKVQIASFVYLTEEDDFDFW